MDNSDHFNLMSALDMLFNPRPVTECCGKIPQDRPLRAFCAYCDMSADWCQCDTSDYCDCENK